MKRKWTLLLSIILVFALCGASLPVSAAAGSCYTIGGDPLVESEVQQLAYYWGKMGYSSWYTVEQGSSYITSTRLNSPVVAFYGHGSSTGITIKKDATSTGYILTTSYSSADGNTVGLRSFSLTSNILMIFGGCETGANTTNLVTRAVAQGSDSAIGWRQVIYAEDIVMWIPRFQYRIYQGYTVQQAVTYANGFSDYGHTSITDVYVLGGSTTIPHYGSTASLSTMEETAEIDCLQEYTVNYPVGVDVEQSLIACIAAATGTQLAAGGYTMQTAPSSEAGVTTYRIQIKRGDFETNTGFAVTVKNGAVVHIAETTADNAGAATMSVAPTVTDADRAAAVAQANAEIAAAYPDATIIEQSGKNCYDVHTNTYYYRVFSTYQFADETKGGHITDYVIV